MGAGTFTSRPFLQTTRHRILARPTEAGRLRFASPFRDCFSKIREEHREPEPDRQLRDETAQSRFSGKDSNSR